TSELALIEYRLARDLPVLGICLGSQLMAKALGSRVFAGAVKEIGWGRVELTEAGAASCLGPLGDDDAVVLHWHGDSFDLPRGAQRLASNRHYENQAFAYRRNALALQFHLEADPRRLEQWYIGHAAELAAAKLSVAELRAVTARFADGRAVLADRVFTRWLREVGRSCPRKISPLPKSRCRAGSIARCRCRWPACADVRSSSMHFRCCARDASPTERRRRSGSMTCFATPICR